MITLHNVAAGFGRCLRSDMTTVAAFFTLDSEGQEEEEEEKPGRKSVSPPAVDLK